MGTDRHGNTAQLLTALWTAPALVLPPAVRQLKLKGRSPSQRSSSHSSMILPGSAGPQLKQECAWMLLKALFRNVCLGNYNPSACVP